MNEAITHDLAQCAKPVELASSIPPRYYTDDEIVRSEIDLIFRRQWIGVGRSDMVREIGDFIALDFADQNLILLRDKDTKLRAFANSCRHRNARLVDDHGQCKGLRCPFHSWFYGLDGELVSAPKMEKVPDFDRTDHSLISYRVEEKHGFVFVNLNPVAPELDDYLAEFSEIHAPWPMDVLVSKRRIELEVDCNWKMFLEVFNEYYHLPFVHPDSIDSVYGIPDKADNVSGAFATQFGATEGTGGLLEDSQHNALPDMPGLKGQATRGVRYTWAFPNMTFAANSDALWCYEAYPLGPNKCKVVQTACFHPETIALPDFEAKHQSYLDRMDAALDEDVPALVNQQKGMTCPDAVPGRFQPDLEPNVASFANWYARVMS